jgi:hypothetical protein
MDVMELATEWILQAEREIENLTKNLTALEERMVDNNFASSDLLRLAQTVAIIGQCNDKITAE